eukprot:scaffold5631_cov167-Amphora_coffeaeformis.AAC.6
MAPNDQKCDSSNVLTPEEGDVVSWKWGGGHPKGEVVDVKTGEAQISTKNGNTVARHGTDGNPAVKIVSRTTGSTVLKKASEINVCKKHEEKRSGEKRPKPTNDTTENRIKPQPKKLKPTQAVSADRLEEKLEGKGLTTEDKELAKEHVEELTKEDMKQPVSRRTRSSNRSKVPLEAQLERQLFGS